MSEVSGQVASAQSKVVKWIKYYPNCNTMIKKKWIQSSKIVRFTILRHIWLGHTNVLHSRNDPAMLFSMLLILHYESVWRGAESPDAEA